MARLLVLVEGETEETFVNELLSRHLCSVGFLAVSARLLGNSRQRTRRGGIRNWNAALTEIVRHLSRDPAVFLTTMVDYYGLPQTDPGSKGWPGRLDAASLPYPLRAVRVEEEMLNAVKEKMSDSWNPKSFIPFVVMHEFEGLLFSDCRRFAGSLGSPALEAQLRKIRDAFASPEEINDSPLTHPSARLSALLTRYQKPLFGNIAALDIGLEAIRRECPHFEQWIHHLESLPGRTV